ncbi:MAG TPA: ATP-binding protein [Chthoniobacterales bacterium]|nr:ATP-binding protein [Chthoniobacterales bacterium]
MFWLGLATGIGATVIFSYVVWLKWVSPWRQIEEIVRQIAQGGRPTTFLVEGALSPRRVGLALEELFVGRQKLGQELAERLAGSETILGAMPEGLLVVDAERRITLLNRTFRDLFGLNDDSLGQPLLEAVRDVSIEQAVAETLQTGQAVRRELVISNRQMQMSGVPMKNELGRTSGAVFLIHDITELKRADEIRKDFVANVSHELRTPLSILRGYIETLRDDPNISTEESTRILEVMDRHSRRLGRLVDDLLALAKLESGGSKLQMSQIDLSKLFADVVRDWEKKLAEKNLKVTVDLPKSLPPLRADEARLQEVLYNLIDNAVKYSPQNGKIGLQASQRDGDLVLCVTDNGTGIAKEDLPRIFERFYRVDKARSRALGGTGLGLSIVKHIAQLHGGRAEAESEAGKGTRVSVILPIKSE